MRRVFAAWVCAASLALGGAGAGVVGCAGAPPADPSSVLHAYAQALEEGRADDAYRLLSDDARRGISIEAFRRAVKDDPEGMAEIGRSLARPTTPAVVTATVTS